MDDERELLAAWRAGDRQAGSRLIAARSRETTRFFRNKVYDEDAVPDLVSQTFLRCVSALDLAAVCIGELQPRSLSSLHSEKVRVQALIEALRDVPLDSPLPPHPRWPSNCRCRSPRWTRP